MKVIHTERSKQQFCLQLVNQELVNLGIAADDLTTEGGGETSESNGRWLLELKQWYQEPDKLKCEGGSRIAALRWLWLLLG